MTDKIDLPGQTVPVDANAGVDPIWYERLQAMANAATRFYAMFGSGSGGSGSAITSSLGADVALNSIGSYFSGPSVAQGTTGTWFASGTVTVRDTAGAAGMFVKLWDGTTVISSAFVSTSGAGVASAVSVSGYITAPVGNIRISCRDGSSGNGLIVFNQSGNAKDSTITAFRIA